MIAMAASMLCQKKIHEESVTLPGSLAEVTRTMAMTIMKMERQSTAPKVNFRWKSSDTFHKRAVGIEITERVSRSRQNTSSVTYLRCRSRRQYRQLRRGRLPLESQDLMQYKSLFGDISFGILEVL